MMNDVDDDLGENYIETDRLRQLEYRRQVDSNDPSLLHAQIGSETIDGYIPHDGDWGEFGASIGRNTCIEEVDISISQGDFEIFARGFASNRSVKSLTIYCEELDNGDALSALLPFFMNNPTFKSLHIMFAEPTCLQMLASVLRQFDPLTEFTLYDHEHYDDDHFDESGELFEEYNDSEDYSAAVNEVIDALACHSSLTTLRLEFEADGRQYRSIPMNGLESLIAMLRRPSSNLVVLELKGTPMDNLGAYILAAGLLVNASLKEFALHSTHMTKDGWDAIFAALKKSTCTLEKLSIYMSQRMEDDVLLSLSNAFLDNCTLKTLFVHSGHGEYAPSSIVTNRGALFQLLHNPVCALEILHLGGVGLNNDSIMCLRDVIANNSRLRELQLGRNHNVTTDGWVNFLTFPSNAKLETLVLGYSDNINDEALDGFRNSLMNNRRLKNLHLAKFPNVTTAGWTSFSAVLRNPNFLLEKLCLGWGDGSYDDVVVNSFADALTNNKRLRELEINCRIENFAPFTRIVCNSSSIMSTYNSNHILCELNHYPRCLLPIDLASSLQINRENGVSKAARLKIIKTHFSGSNINTTPFTVMELKVLPNAISWMGRECGISKISNLLFVFVRSMPSLCDTKNRYKKRKSVD
jgi:hypothetical protein